MRSLLRGLMSTLIIFSITFAGIEAVLRLVPQVVPLVLLARFQKDIRSEIAAGRNFATDSVMRELVRDDGGPPLRTFQPFSSVRTTQRDTESDAPTQHDANGFCNPDHSLATRPTIDVVAIGDSFTYCTATEPGSAWPTQLGILTGLPVYNLGLGRNGLYEYLQMFKAFMAEKSPKIVVMNVYEGNDLRDAVRYHQYLQDQVDRHFERAGEYQLDVLQNAFGRSSYAFNMIVAATSLGSDWIVYKLIKKRPPSTKDVDFRYTLQFTDRAILFNTDNSDRDEVAFARQLVAGEISTAVFDQALQAFVDLAAQRGFKPLVVYTPSAHTAYVKYAHFSDPALQTLMPRYSDILRSYFRAGSDKLGYRYIDLTPVLQAKIEAAGPGQLLYFPGNVHYTSAGHRVVAEALAPTIEAMLR